MVLGCAEAPSSLLISRDPNAHTASHPAMVTTRSQAAAQRAPCQGPGHVPCPKVQPSPQSLPGIGGCDPLEALGCDLLGHVLQFLGPVHLLQASLVSKQWQAVAYEERRWQQHCQVSASDHSC